MKQKYLFVALVDIDWTSVYGDEDPSPEDPFRQNAAADYLHYTLRDSMHREDPTDRVIDSVPYALGVCIGRDKEAHEHGVKRGDVEWCSTCGAIKVGDAPWQLPDIRIDRKE